ncbi:MAG: SatD family protein, partial [Yaniella sp.]|nr:SatD family protein [Yaniella sp.]
MMQAVGIIADIVDSREMVDRSAGQRAITDAFAEAETAVSPIRPAWATVGDEFQVIVATWQDSLRLTLRMQALLPDGIQLRYGIGAGQINTIEQGESGPIQDGTAWLHARAAIDEVEERQQRRDDVMSGFCSDDVDLATAVRTQLMVRDHVLGRMKARERRLLSALLCG